MSLRARRLSPLLLLLPWLAACERHAGDADPFFPLRAGHRWRYQIGVTTDSAAAPSSDTLELRALGASEAAGAPAWRRRSDSGIEYWLRADERGVLRVASRHPLQHAAAADTPARYVLRKPYAVGTEWDSGTTTYVLRRRNEFPNELRHLPSYRALTMHYRIGAVGQSVDTPAGPFHGCLRVDGRALIRLYVDELFTWRDVTLLAREWYCPGVGLVLLEREEPSPTKFIVGGSLRMALTDWR